MSITISDPALLAQLAAIQGEVELKDPSGRTVAKVTREWDGKLPPGVKSPISDEEFERLRQTQRPGRKLADIIRDLEGRRT
jgi:hypothetical protein